MKYVFVSVYACMCMCLGVCACEHVCVNQYLGYDSFNFVIWSVSIYCNFYYSSSPWTPYMIKHTRHLFIVTIPTVMRTITKKHRLESTYLTKKVNTQIKRLRTVFSSTTFRRDKTNCENLLIPMFSLAVSDRSITTKHTNRRNRMGEQPCCNTLPQYLVDRQRRKTRKKRKKIKDTNM